MATLHLVRHGQAAAGFDADLDPGLDATGRAQAEAMADRLAPLGPLPIVVSPLRRTRETAAALERRWRVTARVEPAVGEIPSPGLDLGERGSWLRRVLAGDWADLDPTLQEWRQRALDALAAIDQDTVVVTHYVLINAVVGLTARDDRVICCRPHNCSCTVVEASDGRLRLVQLGEQASTAVG